MDHSWLDFESLSIRWAQVAHRLHEVAELWTANHSRVKKPGYWCLMLEDKDMAGSLPVLVEWSVQHSGVHAWRLRPQCPGGGMSARDPATRI